MLVALYDDKPVPKVIDFGVAKATGRHLTEETLNTGFGAVVGTPQYMCPGAGELNNLDVDTRSDVYSLGVLLYELLTGSPPFTREELEKKGLVEMLRVVREEEPPKPSTRLRPPRRCRRCRPTAATEPGKLAQALRGELDWVVLKALEKDRARRYETANGLAADVQRYLSGEPVAAGPPGTLPIGKFARRHRAALTTAAAIVLLLVAGVAVSSWQAVRAWRAKVVARAAESDAKAQKAKAEQSAAMANAANDQAQMRLVRSRKPTKSSARSLRSWTRRR